MKNNKFCFTTKGNSEPLEEFFQIRKTVYSTHRLLLIFVAVVVIVDDIVVVVVVAVVIVVLLHACARY